jgi:VanZ family protein
MMLRKRLWLMKLKSHIFMILFIGLFVAVSDEFFQLFVNGRAGLVQDVVLDFVGFVFGMLVYMGMSLVFRSVKRCK